MSSDVPSSPSSSSTPSTPSAPTPPPVVDGQYYYDSEGNWVRAILDPTTNVYSYLSINSSTGYPKNNTIYTSPSSDFSLTYTLESTGSSS